MSEEYERFKNMILGEIPQIPDLITQDWLENALKDDLFLIWGFSFSDLSDKRFADDIDSEVLNRIVVSTKTIFPDDSPINFDKKMFNFDENIKKLHDEGIVGTGVNVAVIDYGFKAVPDEIKDNMVLYDKRDDDTHFHGSIVSSILVGKNIGVCPDAKLYFFQGTFKNHVADAIDSLKKIYALNEKGANIRIVNISSSKERESDQFELMCEKLKTQGCYVIDCEVFANDFTSINRSYKTGEYYYSVWQKEYGLSRYNNRMGVSICTQVAPLNETESDYQYEPDITYSWGIPALSGIFALALQVNPDLTYDEFVKYAYETKIVKEDRMTLINPVGIIDRINQNIEIRG